LPFPMFGLLVGAAVWAAAACLHRELGRRAAVRASLQAPHATSPRAMATAAREPALFDASVFAVVVFLAGIVGARIFHILEHMDQFLAAPASMVFTRSGFSILGGLILGAAAGIAYTRKAKEPVAAMCDAVAPCLMLGYAIGRLGCQISGDGDWGMAANLALKPDALPLWLWAQTYDGNIAGALIAPPGVYPTPIYESAMAVVCFLILQSMRRHPFRPGWLFACYLVLAGLERLLIERIRVNPTFEIAGWVATQSEFISVLFVLLGLAGMLVLGRRPIQA
jgi:phosphatidylglycerol:prolipoprotein diacylglycerol transferase